MYILPIHHILLIDNMDAMQEEEETMHDDDEECRIFSGLGNFTVQF
jgi:hypothetical protein